MKKLSNLVGFLLIGFVLPLSVQASLLANWKIATLMAAAAVLVLTQPAITLSDGQKNAATDSRSIWAIVLLSFPSIIVPVVDWAFLQPFLLEKMGSIALIEWDGPVAQNLALALPNSMWSAWSAVGLALIVGGLAVRIWAIRTLGRAFTCTVQIVDNHGLITSGPYRFVRHPSYLGAYLMFIGFPIFLHSWFGLAVAAACMGWAYALRIPAEERTLSAAFGQVWEKYSGQTNRLVPGIW